MMKKLVVALGLAAIMMVGTTLADPPIIVTQAGMKFSAKDLQVNKGQTVVFLNDDTTSHNITVTGDGNGVSVNGGMQPPGDKFEMPFVKPGTYLVSCGIHPKMHMTIIVKQP